MVLNNNRREIYIDAGHQDMSRPAERPSKSNWKIEAVKKGVKVLQHISPQKASEIIWHHFTKPGRSRYTPLQRSLISKAEIGHINYKGDSLHTYKWGNGKKKILLSHGWNSKIADFRRIIEKLVEQGFTVEGIDMRGHGKSEGKHTALPEMKEILKNYYVKNGPYYGVIGYSIGGLAAGITISELSRDIQPKELYIIAAPSHSRYFFKDVIADLGYSEKVYLEMCGLVLKEYNESVDYYDLRKKTQHLNGVNLHLIYDENDATVPFSRGEELKSTYTKASFVHTKGLGHYKVISYPEVINYISENISLS